MQYFNNLPLLQQRDFAIIGEYIYESVLMEEQEFKLGQANPNAFVSILGIRSDGEWVNTGKYIWGFNSKVSAKTLDCSLNIKQEELFFECVDKLYQNGRNTSSSSDVPIFLIFKVQNIVGRASQSPAWLPPDYRIGINVISIVQYLRQLINENPETYSVEIFRNTKCLESLHI